MPSNDEEPQGSGLFTRLTTWISPEERNKRVVLILSFLLLTLVGLGIYFFARVYLFAGIGKKQEAPKIIVENLLSEAKINLDEAKLLGLWNETGLLRGNEVINLDTTEPYKPSLILLSFREEDNLNNVILMESYGDATRMIQGYDVEQTPENYKIIFYFPKEYLESLSLDEITYNLNSILIKASLNLGKTSQEKRRLSANERLELLKSFPLIFEKYQPLTATKI